MSGTESNNCPICLEEANGQLRTEKNTPIWHFLCPRCGGFIIEPLAVNMAEDPDPKGETTLYLGKKGSRERANLSGWLRENNEKGRIIRFDTSFFDKKSRDIDRIAFQSAAAQVRTFHDRADKLLLTIERYTNHAGQYVSMGDDQDKFIALSWAKNGEELEAIVEYFGDREFVTYPNLRSLQVKIAPNGWAHLEELKEKNPESRTGFMAMWFDPSLDEVWKEALYPGIENAWYEPVRIDEEEFAGYIMDEVFSQIRKARFVVADLTGDNPNVYLEAGFAMGLNIPVIATKSDDEKDDGEGKRSPFDLAQYGQIRWKDGEWDDLRKNLTARIEFVLGRGPRKPPDWKEEEDSPS